VKQPAINDKKSKKQGQRAISQRNQVELALEASEKKYSTIVEKGNDGIVIIQDGLVKFFNSKMSEMTGYSIDEGIGKPFINCVSPASRKLVFERYEKRLAGESVPNRYEFEMISKNGTNIPVEVNASIIDYEGKPADMAIIRDITERKRTEKALEAALIKADDEKNRTEAVISAIGDGIIIQDTDYKVIYQNQIQTELYGNHVGEDCYKAYGGCDKICEDCPVEISFRDGKIHRLEKTVITGDSAKHLELTSSPLRDSSGKIIAGIKVVRDITEQKRLEEALRERERFLNGIFESIQDGIGIIDTEMNILRVNPTARKWYPQISSFTGKKCYTAFHGRKEPCENCPSLQTIKTGKAEYQIMPKHGQDGKEIGWVEIYSYPMFDKKSGEMTGVIEYVRDITERKRAEEKLKLLSEAVETALDGIQIVSLEGRITYSNRAVEEIYGFSRDELIGKHVNEMNDDPDIAEKFILPSIKETGSWVGELLVKHKDGSVFPIWLSTSLVMNDKGVPIAMVGIINDMTERKEAERKLNESHAFLQSVINGVAEPIMVIDKNYRVKLMNQAARGGIYEVPDNLCCYQISHHSDKPCINSEHPCPLEEVSRTGRPVTVVHEHFKVNGKKRYFEILASPLYDTDSVFSGIVESSRDITERKRVEYALRESEQAYRTLSENLPGIVYRIYLRENNRMRFFNKLAQTVTGYREEELSAGDICLIEDIIVPEDRDRVISEVKSAIADNKSFSVEYGLKHKDGSIRYMLEHGTPIYENGEPLYIDGVIYDNTERKRAEAALHESEEKYRSLVENINLGITLIDSDHRIIMTNPAMGRMFNKPVSEFVGKECFREFEKRDAVCAHCPGTRAMVAGQPAEVETEGVRDDGSQFSVHIHAFPFFSADGKTTGFIEVVEDITERKRVEDAIRRYTSELEESNKMKELFTDIMHHDLLNPLNTVGGFIEILKDEEDEPRKKIYLETIERNLAKGVELIESATTLSRLESLQSIEFENIDIADVIGNNIENIRQEAEKAGVQIENHITQCMPVRANRIIEEVFSNLFSNAIKYASSGKKIIVDSKETGGFWRVNFVDFGDGIKDSEKTLIFERFRRLEKKGVKGSGLGLAIAKKILELHNGRIRVEDNPEGGAIFVVEIPKD